MRVSTLILVSLFDVIYLASPSMFQAHLVHTCSCQLWVLLGLISLLRMCPSPLSMDMTPHDLRFRRVTSCQKRFQNNIYRIRRRPGLLHGQLEKTLPALCVEGQATGHDPHFPLMASLVFNFGIAFFKAIPRDLYNTLMAWPFLVHLSWLAHAGWNAMDAGPF